jgi:hypothetical protein
MRIISAIPAPADREFMEQFYEQYCNEGMDANVNQAILDGSWPSAVEQLEEALIKAKQKREQNGKR